MKFALLFVGLLAACQPQPASAPSTLTAETTQPESAPTTLTHETTQPASAPTTRTPETAQPAEHEEPTVQEPVVMDNEVHPAVTKVIYIEANGSLPPPSQYENNFELTAEDIANFNELVDAALDQTRVNDAVSLRGYMVLRLNNDPRFAQVESISARDVHPKGGQSTTVKFILADGREFAVSNYAERLSGMALANLKRTAREKGKAEMPTTDSLIPPG